MAHGGVMAACKGLSPLSPVCDDCLRSTVALLFSRCPEVADPWYTSILMVVSVSFFCLFMFLFSFTTQNASTHACVCVCVLWSSYFVPPAAFPSLSKFISRQTPMVLLSTLQVPQMELVVQQQFNLLNGHEEKKGNGSIQKLLQTE